MYLLLTHDRVLFQAVSCLLAPESVISIRHTADICPRRHQNACVIVDTLHNNVLHTPLMAQLRLIRPRQVYILSPFGIRRYLSPFPVTFIPRNLSGQTFRETVTRGAFCAEPPALFFTLRQHLVLTFTFMGKSEQYITDVMNIGAATLQSHRHNICLMLNLGRFSQLIRHPFAAYLHRGEQARVITQSL